MKLFKMLNLKVNRFSSDFFLKVNKTCMEQDLCTVFNFTSKSEDVL